MTAFRDELAAIAPAERDAWLDRTLGLGDLPADEPLPRHCVPYLPCSVDTILRAIAHAKITAADTFVDIGAGVGRAAAYAQPVAAGAAFFHAHARYVVYRR